MSRNNLEVRGYNRETWTEDAFINSVDNFGVFAFETTEIEFPERDLEFISVPGRNGDLSYDNGKWKNVDLSFWLVAYTTKEGGRTVSGREKIASFLAALGAFRGYVRLFYTGYNDTHDFFRVAIFTGGMSVENQKDATFWGNSMSKSLIRFSAKPQRYLFDDLNGISVPANSQKVIENPTFLTALPEVRIRAPGTIRANNAQIQFIPEDTGITQVILDCELKNAIGKGEGATWENANSQLWTTSADWFPLPPGNVTIINGTNAQLSIFPRWWTL